MTSLRKPASINTRGLFYALSELSEKVTDLLFTCNVNPPLSTREAFQIAYYDAVATIYSATDGATQRATTRVRSYNNLTIAVFVLFAFLMLASTAGAASAVPCAGKAANNLLNGINFIVGILVVFAGSLFLLMTAIGAGFIVSAGHNSARVYKGMEMVKNACIGISAVAFGVTFKELILSFITGATKQQYKGVCA